MLSLLLFSFVKQEILIKKWMFPKVTKHHCLNKAKKLSLLNSWTQMNKNKSMNKKNKW